MDTENKFHGKPFNEATKAVHDSGDVKNWKIHTVTYAKELLSLEQITKEVEDMYENTQYFLNLPDDMTYQRKEIAKNFVCSKAVFDVATIIAGKEVNTLRSAFHELVESSITNAINEMNQLLS